MNTLVQYLAVGVAGFFGAVARLLVARVCGRVFDTSFPVGTLVINISGSLLLGWLVTFLPGRVSVTTRDALAIGFVGAYTTFSTFMFESNALVERGAAIMAMVNLLGSLVLGLIAVRMGIALGSVSGKGI
jgi:CrcB protein